MGFTRRKTNNTGKIYHKSTIVDGIKFDSEMESLYYKYLLELKEKGIVKDFILQPAFPLQEKFIIVEGKIILGSDENFNKLKRKYKAETISAITYISDFDVLYTDGHREIVDVKGMETADFKLKLKLFKCKYPELNIRLLKLYRKEWIDLKDYKKILKENKKRKI